MLGYIKGLFHRGDPGVGGTYGGGANGVLYHFCAKTQFTAVHIMRMIWGGLFFLTVVPIYRKGCNFTAIPL